MGGEAADGVHPGLHRQVVAEHADALGAVDDLAADGAGGLEADDHQPGGGFLEVVAEVVDDAPTVAHTGAGDDDRPAVDAVDGHGLLHGAGHAQHRQVLAGVAAGGLVEHLEVVGVERLARPVVELGDFDRHGAIEEHQLLAQAPLVVEHAEVVEDLLAAPHRERGDQHVAAVGVGLLQHAGELLQGLLQGTMVAVAVGALHQHQVGLIELLGVLHQHRAGIAQVAGEHQALLLAAGGHT